MARRIKVGLVGLGSLAQRSLLPHLACPDALERVAPVALCDVAPGRARALAGRYGWLEAYDDLDDLLRRADVEAVLLATPIPLHAAQALAALRAGKHVYVQKTMATTLSGADAVVEAAEAAGLTVVASPGQMLHPLHRQLRALIGSGALGKVHWAFGANAGGAHEHEPIRAGPGELSELDPTWYYKAGGGPVYDATVYSLHALTGILGPARAVAALSGVALGRRRWRGREIEVEVDDNTLMLLDFGGGTFAVAGGHSLAAREGVATGRLAFFGGEGTVEAVFAADDALAQAGSLAGVEVAAPRALAGTLGFAGGTFVAQGGGDAPHVVGAHRALPEPHAYADVMHLVDCLADGSPPGARARHARHVVEIIEAAYRAARTGQRQALATTFEAPVE